MAEFSKQYCERHDFDFPHDFDINEIAEELNNGHYTSIICEGYGFIAIGKDDAGKIILAMPTGEYTEEGSDVEWKLLKDVIK
jgi:hypothetical protein